MGLLDSLFGTSKARRDLYDSSASAQSALDRAKAEAEAALRTSSATGRSDINTGYDAANGIYDRAQPGIMDTLGSGYDAARGDLTTGYGNAENAITTGVNNANANLDPWVTSGRAAQDRYDQALGLAGPDASKEFYDSYASGDSYRAYRDELANKQITNQFSGSGRTGAMSLAVGRASLERGSQDLQTYLSRLEQAGQRGQAAAGQKSNNTMSGAQSTADIRAKLGTSLADNSVNRGTSLAQLGKQFADTRAGLETSRGTTLAGLETGTGKSLGELAYGYGQQTASNRINTGNAVAQTRTAPMNNLISLIGTGINGMSLYSNWGTPKRTA